MNESVFDHKQWCELHFGHCDEGLTILKRRISSTRVEHVLVCTKCARLLRDAKLVRPSKWGNYECLELNAPERPKNKSLLISYQVELNTLQVRYLRALGFRCDRAQEVQSE